MSNINLPTLECKEREDINVKARINDLMEADSALSRLCRPPTWVLLLGSDSGSSRLAKKNSCHDYRPVRTLVESKSFQNQSILFRRLCHTVSTPSILSLHVCVCVLLYA